MTSHEFARLLTLLPDLPILVSVDDQYGLLSPPREPSVEWFRPAKGADNATLGTKGDDECIVVSPEDRG